MKDRVRRLLITDVVVVVANVAMIVWNLNKGWIVFATLNATAALYLASAAWELYRSTRESD